MQVSPSFDTWTAGFLIAVAMGLFLFTVLLSNRNKKTVPIAFFVLGFSLILLQYVLYWTQYQFMYPYLVFFPPVCYFATGPLLYWYFLNLYNKPIPRYFELHFVPAVLCFIPYVFNLLKNNGFGIDYVPLASLPQYYQLTIVHLVVYALLLVVLKKKNASNTSEYSTIRNRWALVLIVLYVLFITAYLSYYILVNFSFFNAEWDYAISIMMTLSIYTIGYFTFKQPKVFDGEFYAEIFLPNVSNFESFENQILEELYKKITSHMAQEKPYLDNELRLANLADQLGFTTHLLSKVINKKSGGNFNQFVNQYRLEAAEDMLKKDPSIPIKMVYFDVGFNSKAAFYSAFKEKHHCTPLQYRQGLELS
ncbi:AraC family transcriptional regulator [Marinirhabdus gelatinilytica]|uniref:AraC family transcriptional regulator n=1 Tax=Marinirhabdus gelatinilytica TaxID=1703343 RepID=A0A370Q749_9FLAO|nr:helix-turn-helix domain-containing protein [Marinirhabdus gelatinilytica]RDK84202.1 AraC family transcriptional regulator [Marinirhabdus gelatinilytica]